jgi:uncharacterized membrane protein
MAFCTQCGNPVGPLDIFCAKCGARQPNPGPTSSKPFPGNDFLKDVTPRAASMLCYIPVVGWIPAVLVLAANRFQHDRTVRFHAFQGLYLFVIWLLVDWVVSPILGVGHGSDFHEGRLIRSVLHLAVFAAWIFMIIKTSHEEMYRLPIVGELADRSVSEQR